MLYERPIVDHIKCVEAGYGTARKGFNKVVWVCNCSLWYWVYKRYLCLPSWRSAQPYRTYVFNGSRRPHTTTSTLLCPPLIISATHAFQCLLKQVDVLPSKI